jgi:hypothetical protein
VLGDGLHATPAARDLNHDLGRTPNHGRLDAFANDSRVYVCSGGPAAEVTPSAANGAAVQALIVGFAAAKPLRALR